MWKQGDVDKCNRCGKFYNLSVYPVLLHAIICKVKKMGGTCTKAKNLSVM